MGRLRRSRSHQPSVADFRKALRSTRYSNVKPVARTLDELLMQPVRKLLGNTRTVLLSPDSQLNLIPSLPWLMKIIAIWWKTTPSPT
jgi:hypothetical protein